MERLNKILQKVETPPVETGVKVRVTQEDMGRLRKHNAELAFAEMTASEKMVLTILVIITIAIGVYPGMLLDVVHKGLQLTGI